MALYYTSRHPGRTVSRPRARLEVFWVAAQWVVTVGQLTRNVGSGDYRSRL